MRCYAAHAHKLLDRQARGCAVGSPLWSHLPTPNITLSHTSPTPPQIYLWSLKTGRLLDILAGHEGPVSCLAFSPAEGGGLLASGSWDKTVRCEQTVWRARALGERAEAFPLNGHAVHGWCWWCQRQLRRSPAVLLRFVNGCCVSQLRQDPRTGTRAPREACVPSTMLYAACGDICSCTTYVRDHGLCWTGLTLTRHQCLLCPCLHSRTWEAYHGDGALKALQQNKPLGLTTNLTC